MNSQTSGRQNALAPITLEVLDGLQSEQKTLPCKLLYDAVGSALFEAICQLREYGCTRGEMRILEQRRGELFSLLPGNVEIVELGGGSGEKARILMEGIASKAVFHAIDISASAIKMSRTSLAALPNIHFFGHVADFNAGLQMTAKSRLARAPLLVLFLGSSIGNFSRNEAAEFLRQIRSAIDAGDYLLLGTDLVKPRSRLISAYDDPQGVTSAFNKNILSRINYELSANFDLSKFQHFARWNRQARRVEMHLRSLIDQQVSFSDAGATISFKAGETILTEMSHKYLAHEVPSLAAAAGFSTVKQWIDEETLFASNLLQAVA